MRDKLLEMIKLVLSQVTEPYDPQADQPSYTVQYGRRGPKLQFGYGPWQQTKVNFVPAPGSGDTEAMDSAMAVDRFVRESHVQDLPMTSPPPPPGK